MAGIMAEMQADFNIFREVVEAGLEELAVAEELALSRVVPSAMTAQQADRIQQLWRNLWDRIEAAGHTIGNMRPSAIPTTRRLITALLNVAPPVRLGQVEPPLRVQHLQRALHNIDGRFTAALEREAYVSHRFSFEWDNRNRLAFHDWATTQLEDLRYHALSQESIDLIERGLEIMDGEILEDLTKFIDVELSRPEDELQERILLLSTNWVAVTAEQAIIARQVEQDAWQEEAIAFFEREGRDVMQGAQWDEWLENDVNPFERNPEPAEADLEPMEHDSESEEEVEDQDPHAVRLRAINELLTEVQLITIAEDRQFCPICSDPYLSTEAAANGDDADTTSKVPVLLHCPPGHSFCRRCITTWLLEKSTCPLCRHGFALPGQLLE